MITLMILIHMNKNDKILEKNCMWSFTYENINKYLSQCDKKAKNGS